MTHFLFCICIFILFLPKQWEHCTKLTHYFYFTSWFVHLINLVYRRKGWCKEGLKGKRTMGFTYLSVFFYLIIFSISGWLIQGGNGSKRGCDRNPWLFVFYWFEWKAWLLGAVSTPPSAYSGFVTHFELVLLNSPYITNPEFCAPGHCKHYVGMGWQEMVWPHTLTGLSSAHTHFPLSHQTSFTNKFKVTLMKNLKTLTAEH